LVTKARHLAQGKTIGTTVWQCLSIESSCTVHLGKWSDA